MSPPPPRRRRPAAATAGLGGDQVEGRRAVRELLSAGRRRVRDVWVVDAVAASAPMAEIVELAAERGVAVRAVARARLEAVARTEAPQGVIAHAEPLVEADLDQLCRSVPGWPPPFLLAFDGITDPHNLGALIRTAACAGATGAILTHHRSAHVTPTVAKVAAGGIEHLPLALVAGLPAALARLRTAGVWVVGLDPEGSDSVFDLTLATEPVALVLGAEGGGLSRLVQQRCDMLVSIPRAGGPNSLNVSAAGAVGCYEVVRRRQAGRKK
ncbi:MAG TPA: 23S rRNA (guanosine(2251)-2'-O)-methyltransferase RlmB [Acidimicrobiales bacterium]|nr:23S rRNA (guanosine(2251)-2'-O)-methyltransferase RlmB [Acidimicrobiales bacterium]